MRAIDISRANWEEIRGTVTGRRAAALDAWRSHGPGTTREVAGRAGMDILSLRPRSTELLQLGFLRLVTDRDGEGIYAARGDDEVRAMLEAERAAAPMVQAEMGI